jgi:hypothetical protein
MQPARYCLRYRDAMRPADVDPRHGDKEPFVFFAAASQLTVRRIVFQ